MSTLTRELTSDFGVVLGEDLFVAVEETRQTMESLRQSRVASRERFLIGRSADAYMRVFSDLTR